MPLAFNGTHEQDQFALIDGSTRRKRRRELWPFSSCITDPSLWDLAGAWLRRARGRKYQPSADGNWLTMIAAMSAVGIADLGSGMEHSCSDTEFYMNLEWCY